MQELISRIVANVGIDAATAEKAVGAILAFLQSEGPSDKVAQMMASIPGAEQMIQAASGGGGGLLGGLMGGGGGIMGLGTKLMGMGLGMGEISAVSKETMAFARENGSSEAIDEIVSSIPGLSQFV